MATATMKLELRSIKVAKFASEETLCYSAKLYRDGKHIADVSNDGHGGSDNVRPAPGVTYADVREIESYVAETEPRITVSGDHTIPSSLDVWCADQVERHLALRDLRAKLKKAVIYSLPTKPGLWQIKMQGDPATMPARVKAKYPDATILNTLPEVEALALYTGSAS